MPPLRPITLLSATVLWSALATAQEPDSAPGPDNPQEPDEQAPLVIHITAPLIETEWQQAPSGLTLIDDRDIGDGRAPIQPTDALNLSPGVLVQNRNNFAQNPRVSIRGFGARAPFGIRGVRVRLDGIPLTTVDGQAQIDAIDPSAIQTIEVLRGANAVLHGNGSGGLLDYSSHPTRSAPLARAEAQAGGHGLRRLHAAIGEQKDAFAFLGAITQLEQEGYRDQSEVERRNVNLRLDHRQGDRDWFVLLNHLDNPLAEDPGALTEAELQQDPSQAAPLASLMDAGQEVRQNIISAGIEQRLGGADHQLSAQAWLIGRDFEQQLPFPGSSLIRYDRQIVGGALYYQRPVGKLLLHTHLSLEDQADDRQRYCRDIDLEPFSCVTGISDDLALDQLETARNAGLGLQLAGPVAGERGRWVMGLRHDRLRMAIDDNLLAGGIDNSGERVYDEPNYSVGYSHTLNNRWTAFGQYATSFEAPTFTEFANPAGSGFRPGLEPQTSQTLEVGVRGQLDTAQLEATLFTVRVEDEIIVDDDPGAAPGDERTFYRNADRTRRDGLELGARWRPGALPDLQLAGAVTYMDAHFDDETNNALPGLPEWAGFIDARYELKHGYFAGLSTQYIGNRYADDANTVEVASQTVTNLRLGRVIWGSRHKTQLVIGVENLFDEAYLDNLRINATNGRYYEPGAERRLYASIDVSWF